VKGPGIVACILGFCSQGWAGVVVNELLYDPPGDDSGLERIELYNNGSAPVNLAGRELYPARTPYYRFGKSDRGEAPEMGMYVLYLEAIDALHGMLVRAKGTVVLAKRMS